MMDRFPPPAAAAAIPCPDCRGKGQITLLVSVESCDRCQGTGQLHPLLDKVLDDLDLSVRTRSVLRRLGVETIRQLLQLTPASLQGARNSNSLVLREVQELLARHGLTLKAR